MNVVFDVFKKAGEAAKGIIDGTAAQSKNLLVKNAFTSGRLCPDEIRVALQHGIAFFLQKSEQRPLKSVVLSSEFSSSEQYKFRNNDGILPMGIEVVPFDLECNAMYAFRRIMMEYDLTPSLIAKSFLCGDLRDFANPAKSGSLFYLTADDQFILKTVRDYEAMFFKSGLLNDYYHNLAKRKESFLARYFGMYAYTQQARLLTLRFVIMSNIIPAGLSIAERYDLKGSTKGRAALIEERIKKNATLKDLDFLSRHPNGLQLPPDVYDRLYRVIKDDVEILHGWNIIDYSLFVGIHNLSQGANNTPDQSALRALGEAASLTASALTNWNFMNFVNEQKHALPDDQGSRCDLSKRQPGWNFPLARLYTEDEISSARIFDHPVARSYGGIPAMNNKGEQLLIFLGIIDILQQYDASKQFQQFFQGINSSDDEYSRSIIDPDQYATRFMGFVFDRVFRRGQTDLGTNRIGSFRLQSSAHLSRFESDVVSAPPNLNQSPPVYPFSPSAGYLPPPAQQFDRRSAQQDYRSCPFAPSTVYSAPPFVDPPVQQPAGGFYPQVPSTPYPSQQPWQPPYQAHCPDRRAYSDWSDRSQEPPQAPYPTSGFGFPSPANWDTAEDSKPKVPYPTTASAMFPSPEDCIRRSVLTSHAQAESVSEPKPDTLPALPSSFRRKIINEQLSAMKEAVNLRTTDNPSTSSHPNYGSNSQRF